jgi:hypothetical protein
VIIVLFCMTQSLKDMGLLLLFFDKKNIIVSCKYLYLL